MSQPKRTPEPEMPGKPRPGEIPSRPGDPGYEVIIPAVNPGTRKPEIKEPPTSKPEIPEPTPKPEGPGGDRPPEIEPPPNKPDVNT
jgi:hypothetical protein